MSSFPSEDQQRLNRLVATSKEYEAQADQLQMQLEMINQMIAQLQITAETVENLDKLEEGQEFLLPLGNFAFIKAKIMDTSNVIVNIGASIALEKTIAKAKEDFDQRLEEFNKAQMQLRQMMQQVMQQIQNIRNEIESIAARYQEGASQPALGS